MPDFLTTKELASLLRIKERKVYDLAASGIVPCSKAMGKLLFPRDAVDAWLAENASGPGANQLQPRPDVFLGSHDPLLDWALRQSHSGIASYFDGSADGLSRFERREGLAAGLHLFEVTANDWNTPIIEDRCAALPSVLIEWAKRQRGLILNQRLEKAGITGIGDLGGLRVTPRQEGSGAEDLFRHLLKKEKLKPGDLTLTSPARSENDAVLMVLEDKADATFGLAALAAQYRLPFVPIIEERFDLLIDRHAWFEPPLQRFWAFCHSSKLEARAKDFAGYDLTNFGHVHFNGS